VSSKLGSGADVTNGAEQAKTATMPLKNIQTISLYSLIGAVAAGAMILLLAMIMIVRERRREIGVIKAIGASNLKVVGQFMIEAVTLTLLGSIVGIVIGSVAAQPITTTLINNTTSNAASQSVGSGRGARGGFRALQSLNDISTTVGWDIILYGLGGAVIIAIVGSAIAAFFIAKIRPAEVMRTE
jgi:putative ABC transport system permease protein